MAPGRRSETLASMWIGRAARFEIPSARKRIAGIQPRSSKIVGRSSWEYRRKCFSTWFNNSLICATCTCWGSGSSGATSASARCTATSSCPEVAPELPEPQQVQVAQIKELLNQVEKHLRRYSHELRPTILDDLGWRSEEHT